MPATPISSVVSVPAGNYVLRWQGWLYSGSAQSAVCFLYTNTTGVAETVTVPAGQSAFDSYELLVHAASPFTTRVECQALGAASLSATLTATAVGTLHMQGNVTQLP